MFVQSRCRYYCTRNSVESTLWIFFNAANWRTLGLLHTPRCQSSIWRIFGQICCRQGWFKMVQNVKMFLSTIPFKFKWKFICSSWGSIALLKMQKANQVFGQLCYLLGGCQTVSENESLFTQKRCLNFRSSRGPLDPPNVPTANQWFFWPGVYCATFWEVQPCCNIDWRCKKLYFWKSFQSVDVLDKVKTGYQIICWKFWLWSVKKKKRQDLWPQSVAEVNWDFSGILDHPITLCEERHFDPGRTWVVFVKL